MQVAHDDPDGVLMWSWVGRGWERVVSVIRSKRPPGPNEGSLSATLSFTTSATGFAPLVRRPIEDGDDVETKVAKLVHNLNELEAHVNRQDKRHSDRMTKIETTATTHRAHAAALEGRMNVAEQQEQAKWADALPMEALGLAAAGFGQFFTLAGAILLAV